MTLTTLAAFKSARKQRVNFAKTSGVAGSSSSPNTGFERFLDAFSTGAVPAAGTIAGLTDTAAGVLPSNTLTGFPPLESFGGGTGYLLDLEIAATSVSNNVPYDVILYDMIYRAGSYSFNANTTLASQPSISGRVPGGDYGQVELWYQQATAPTGFQNIAVTYTDQDGNTGHTTGTVSIAIVPTVGTMFRIPLANGDRGIQKIESVVGSVASAGTFNLLLIRRLAALSRVTWGHPPVKRGIMQLGLPIIYESSCLALMSSITVTDGLSTAKGPNIIATIAMG